MSYHLWTVFAELVKTPFQHLAMVWGIVPLYFALLLSEMTSAKANFRTAIQTGFSFLWAGAQWLYPYVRTENGGRWRLELDSMSSIHLAVTCLVVLLGLAALISGLRKRFPQYGRFLGYTRFANYFTIMIFPMQFPAQAFRLAWTWERLLAIAVFAVPVWLILHFGLMPLRNR